MMSFVKALERIKHSYDAFYFANKYGEGTHNEEFAKLSELEGEKVQAALAWIKYEYDCYYKENYEKTADTPFKYLEELIKKQKFVEEADEK